MQSSLKYSGIVSDYDKILFDKFLEKQKDSIYVQPKYFDNIYDKIMCKLSTNHKHKAFNASVFVLGIYRHARLPLEN